MDEFVTTPNTSVQDNYLAPISDLIPAQLNPNQQLFSNTPYPAKRVIVSFALLGGAVGGIMVWGVSVMFIGTIVNSLKMLMISLIGSAVIGFVPATLTAVIISKLKIHLIDIVDYLKIFTIGVGTSGTLAFIVLMILEEIKTGTFVGLFLSCIVFGVIGGMSSLILGWFSMPKHAYEMR